MPQHPAEWPANADPDMMTVEDVALRLKASDSFVYGAIADGRLKHHRLGKGQGGIRVSEEQFGAFLKLTERGGDPEPQSPKAAKPRPGPFRHLPPRA